MVTMKRLKRKNKILSKRLKCIHKPSLKGSSIISGYPAPLQSIDKSSVKQKENNCNGFIPHQEDSNAAYVRFRRVRDFFKLS